MSRSIWKGPFSLISFDATKEELKFKNKRSQLVYHNRAKDSTAQSKQSIWARSSMILPQHIGQQIAIHNGKGFLTVNILSEMIQHKFGEFASTRKKPIHKVNKRKQTTRNKQT